MIQDTQIVKGLLEGCILKIIGQEELYGYKAVEILNQHGFSVNEATVYPILTRLENKGLLRVARRPSPLGPMRKYYRLTPDGQSWLIEFAETWHHISQIIHGIMEGDSHE